MTSSASATSRAAALDESSAAALVEAARARSTEIGAPVSVAVVDPGGHLVAFLRMDGAPLLSVQAALDKAWTAASSGVATATWYDIVTADQVLREGMVHTPRFSILAGGVPLFAQGRLVGAVAASGGHYTQDDDIARAAAAAAGLTDAEGAA